MDVVAGESSGSSGQLLLLYPMLFGESAVCASRADDVSLTLNILSSGGKLREGVQPLISLRDVFS